MGLYKSTGKPNNVNANPFDQEEAIDLQALDDEMFD